MKIDGYVDSIRYTKWPTALPNLLVYVIRLHAVKFGNNWNKKLPRTAEIVRGRRPSPIWLSEECFNLIIAELDKHVVLFLINYIAS